ncbi:hypothetical protein LT493_40525 [Streptomyces tricolor]|nr:hypothetical protein [Streptomyces tricolor]
MTKGLARESWGRAGSPRPSWDPGPIDTDMNPADGDSAEWQASSPPSGGTARSRTSPPRWPTWRGPAGRYITGTAIAVDGGYTA